MGEPAIRVATYQDILNAPEGITAEILAGELYLSPRPAPDHAAAEGLAYADLVSAYGRRRGGSGPGGWWFLLEPELHLGDPVADSEVASPDVAGWRRERMPVIPRQPAVTLAPDWVCEVLSPGPRNVRRDRIVKPAVYASRGIRHLWLVDPIGETLEVYELRDGIYARVQAFAGDARVRAVPFDAVELDIGAWWLPAEEPAEGDGGA